MHTSVKKLLVVLLSSLISLGTSCKAENRSNHNTLPTPKDLKQVNQNDHIYKTKEWKTISNFWQQMNNINYGISTNKLIEMYEKLENEYKASNENLRQLLQKKYITQKEYSAIYREVNRKYDDVQLNNPTISCYDTMVIEQKQQILESELEERYKIIEKLFDEGKINTKTFETTKARIEKDLKELYKLEQPKAENAMNSKTADLIINLNR